MFWHSWSAEKPPIWLVPKVIKDNARTELVDAWFASENSYCLQKLRWSALAGSVALFVSIYLDVTYTPPADFLYALRGRGSIGFIALLYFIWLSSRRQVGRLAFVAFKAAFAFFIMACVVYQFQYSIDYTNRARYLPPFIFVLGMYALRVGPSFSFILTVIYGLVMGAFGWRAPQNLQEDVNLLMLAALAVFIFQSRIRYEAKYFVAEWKEKQRLEDSEREAKIMASKAYQELVKLVYPHVVELVQSGKHIEETMPVGHAKAAVICLDIADSSSIIHERFDKAVESFQARLYDLMCEHYDIERLIANGYRIKDVGDGVFYSVGFPFITPEEDGASDRAVDLTLKAIEIFHSEMLKLNYPQRITAGAGVAFGHVEGFFPQAGQKQYDLRGRAIVLATRYQELRKAIKHWLFAQNAEETRHFADCSLIVINESVYNNLSVSRREAFQAFDLKSHGLMVRNDAQATMAYWRAVSYASAISAAEHQLPERAA